MGRSSQAHRACAYDGNRMAIGISIASFAANILMGPQGAQWDPASWTLPAATAGLNRCLYFYQGQSLQLDTETITSPQGVVLQPDRAIELKNGTAESCLLLLQGRPIGEPVAQYGPFVMNSEAEIQQAFRDYQRDQFGGWPWSANDPVLPRDQGRFARYADGKEEKPVNR